MVHSSRGILPFHDVILIRPEDLETFVKRRLNGLDLTGNHIFTVQAKAMQVVTSNRITLGDGLAAASAARILGRKATICVTHDTPKYILDRLKTEGAGVRQNGYFWSDADDLCRQLVKEDPDGVPCPVPVEIG